MQYMYINKNVNGHKQENLGKQGKMRGIFYYNALKTVDIKKVYINQHAFQNVDNLLCVPLKENTAGAS